MLFALEAAVFAGWAPSAPLLQEIARTARDLPPTGDPPDAAPNLLLQGCTARVTGGYADGRAGAAPHDPGLPGG